jgi:hypothetical protein
MRDIYTLKQTSKDSYSNQHSLDNMGSYDLDSYDSDSCYMNIHHRNSYYKERYEIESYNEYLDHMSLKISRPELTIPNLFFHLQSFDFSTATKSSFGKISKKIDDYHTKYESTYLPLGSRNGKNVRLEVRNLY